MLVETTMAFRTIAIVASSAIIALVQSHCIITYPGWRGNNLGMSGSISDTDGLGVAIGSNGSLEYPYGEAWIYPCGGLPVASNRTKWPTTGGAVAVQIGISSDDEFAFMYINLGLGTIPQNYSYPMTHVFQLMGPSDEMYPGTFCIQEMTMPANVSVKAGDNATIQVVQVPKYGNALYSCVDITFAAPSDIPAPSNQACFNSSDPDNKIEFGVVSTTLNSSETSFDDGGSSSGGFSAGSLAGACVGIAVPLLIALITVMLLFLRQRKQIDALRNDLAAAGTAAGTAPSEGREKMRWPSIRRPHELPTGPPAVELEADQTRNSMAKPPAANTF